MILTRAFTHPDAALSAARKRLLLSDWFSAVHLLMPPAEENDSAEMDTALMVPAVQWAQERTIRAEPEDDILLAQIEEQGTDVLNRKLRNVEFRVYAKVAGSCESRNLLICPAF